MLTKVELGKLRPSLFSGAGKESIPKNELRIPNGLKPSSPKDLPHLESEISKVPSHSFTDARGLGKYPFRRTNSEFRTPNSELRIPNSEFRTPNGLAPSGPKDLPHRESGISNAPSHSFTASQPRSARDGRRPIRPGDQAIDPPRTASVQENNDRSPVIRAPMPSKALVVAWAATASPSEPRRR